VIQRSESNSLVTSQWTTSLCTMLSLLRHGSLSSGRIPCPRAIGFRSRPRSYTKHGSLPLVGLRSASTTSPPKNKFTIWTKVMLSSSALLSTTVLYLVWVENRADRWTKKYGGSIAAEFSENMHQIIELPRAYSWDAVHTYWSHRPVSTLYRLGQINYHLLPLLYRYVQDFVIEPKLQQFWSLWNSGSTTEPRDSADRRMQLQHSHAVQWKEALTLLGPAFVKAGQQISIRPDLVAPVILQELQKLCDSVTPIADELAFQILREQLNVEHLTDVFREPPMLVAAASLGQVYRGKLRNANGKDDFDVAIKVQRPGMVTAFSLDLYLLQRFSIVVDTFTSVFTNQPPFHKALYESFAGGSYSELDYEQEAENQMYFYNEFQARRSPVVIPKVYRDYTTRTVLTTEWIDGIKLADAPLEQIRALIPVGVELFLTQLLDLGTFHADPHVGNLLVQNKTGKLCLLDFGLCATIAEKDRRAMTIAILHLMQRDFATLVHQDSKDLGFLPPDCDTSELLPILTKILTVGVIESPTSNIHVRQRHLMEISNELNDVFFRYPFTVPPYFALITRGLGLLEGIALSGDENFNIFHAAAPYARRRAMHLLYGRKTKPRNGMLSRSSTKLLPSSFERTM
jgi:aarF domain-containing kinase